MMCFLALINIESVLFIQILPAPIILKNEEGVINISRLAWTRAIKGLRYIHTQSAGYLSTPVTCSRSYS